MDKVEAEIIATVYSAWNNLLIEKKKVTDEKIVFEARENWKKEKLKIEREIFFEGIEWLRDKGIIPEGKGKIIM